MSWLTTTMMMLNLVPALITAMKALEEAIPTSGLGEQKKPGYSRYIVCYQ